MFFMPLWFVFVFVSLHEHDEEQHEECGAGEQEKDIIECHHVRLIDHVFVDDAIALLRYQRWIESGG